MYNKKIEHNNIFYSVDMLRLKTYMSFSTFSELEFRLKLVWKDYIKQEYTSPKINNFFYNYVIEIEEGQSFWFGFLHNTEKRDEKNEFYNFTIEFNPNKLKDNNILLYILGLSGKWFLKSLDLAMDLKVNILDLNVDFSGRKQMKIFSKGYDDKTIYIGKDDSRIKIYNKKIESKLNILGNLTRVEVSRTFDDFPITDIKFFKFGDKFPNIYLNEYVYSLSDYDDKTLFAILYAVQNGFPLKDLTKTYKRKIKNLLQGGYKILFDEKSATQVINQTIFYYFIKNNKVVFR